jgi:hypothetical protein
MKEDFSVRRLFPWYYLFHKGYIVACCLTKWGIAREQKIYEMLIEEYNQNLKGGER